MSEIFDRSQNRTRNSDSVHRPKISVDAHGGTPEDFRARLVRAAREAAFGISKDDYIQRIFDWLTDERSLICAWRKLKVTGGQSPGVDGVTFADVPDAFAWEHMRDLRDALRNGTYEPDELLLVEVEKSSGLGMRTLAEPTIFDRTLGAAVLTAIQPFFDAHFDARSIGFRPRRDRLLAFAIAERLAIDEGRHFWSVLDVKDAFPSVPRQRLLQVLKSRLPNESLIRLIDQLSGTGKKGIHQGQPVCPLLLNIFLDHFVDRVWRRQQPNIPLIRVADDMLLLCSTAEESRIATAQLLKILRDCGLKAKGDSQRAAVNVTQHAVDWLGVQIQIVANKLIVRLPDGAYSRLERRFVRAHHEPNPPRRAIQCILGWFDQQGLALTAPRERDAAIRRILKAAQRRGFDELPPRAELRRAAHRGALRFDRLRRVVAQHPSLLGSAPAERPRPGSAPGLSDNRGERTSPALGPAPSFREAIVIYTDGAALGPQGPGGWAYLIRRWPLAQQEINAGGASQATNNQMELFAVIAALERVADRALVRVIVDSTYVVECINGRLQRLHDDGKLFPTYPLANNLPNQDLLQRLFAHLNRMHCDAEHVHGHSGVAENEICDRLALSEAVEQSWRDNPARSYRG